jgi:hypothetical protein
MLPTEEASDLRQHFNVESGYLSILLYFYQTINLDCGPVIVTRHWQLIASSQRTGAQTFTSTKIQNIYKMSDDLTPLSLPTTLPYPITLTRLHAQPGQSITRGAPLISYTFTSSTNARELARLEKGLPPTEGIRVEDVREGDMSATWECGLDGEFVKFENGIEVGRVVERKHASYVTLIMRS